jgi:hypothetical protein
VRVRQVFAHYEQSISSTGGIKYCPSCGVRLGLEEIGNRPRAACLRCDFVHFRNPAATVSVLVVDGDYELLEKRSGAPAKSPGRFPVAMSTLRRTL